MTEEPQIIGRPPCRTCKYWEPVLPLDLKNPQGHCHWGPPVPVMVPLPDGRISIQVMFPQTYGAMSCYQHVPKLLS